MLESTYAFSARSYASVGDSSSSVYLILVSAWMYILVTAWAHSLGIHLLQNIDDWLVLASLEVQPLQDRDHLLAFCRNLGGCDQSGEP